MPVNYLYFLKNLLIFFKILGYIIFIPVFTLYFLLTLPVLAAAPDIPFYHFFSTFSSFFTLTSNSPILNISYILSISFFLIYTVFSNIYNLWILTIPTFFSVPFIFSIVPNRVFIFYVSSVRLLDVFLLAHPSIFYYLSFFLLYFLNSPVLAAAPDISSNSSLFPSFF